MRFSTGRWAALTLLALTSSTVSAQGLADPRTSSVLPNAAAAAVDDATAIFTNPAGLGAVSGIELGAGYSNRFFGVGFDHATDGIIAASGPLGTVAAGFSMSSPALGRGRLVTSIGGGLQLDESILVGVALHSVDGELPTVDLGTQLRLSRGLAVGLVGENLATDNGAFRLGVSVRPLDELLTLGVDARFKPAPFDNPGQALLGGAFTPALTARLHLGGVVVGIAGEVQNLGGLSPVTGTATALLQVDLDHMGVALQGGADGIAADVTGSVVGVRGRLSTTAWESLLPEGGRWLELRLADDGGVVDDDDSLFDALFGSTPSALQVLAMLDNAAEDESVEGVMLRLEGLSLGFGAAAELRGAIQRLRENGKKVAVYMVSGDDIDAWVASAADRVWIAPSGGLGVDGVRGRLIYLADVLGRLGITAEAVSAGKYKSAPRTFTHTEPSEEEIEVENALLDGAYNALVAGLAEGRDKSPDEIKAIIDLGGLSASEALEHGMVDALAYNDEVGQLLAELAGRPGERVGTEARFYEDAKKLNRWGGAASIAVIPIEGTIQMGRSQGGLFGGSGAGADDVVDAINRAKNDDDVVAIVLRINSPGGDALASDLMWRAAMLARDVKPVIASMGDVAASGGYYVAAAANTIVAEPNTITGSIGVFGLMFNAEGLVNDLGIRSVEFQRGARPGPDLFRGMTDVERERLQHSVDATYERFLTAIVEGRGEDRITKDALREIAEGRVWTGAQAKERALVDEEGSIIDALRIARERAGLTSTDDLALSVYTKDGGIPIVGALGGMMAMALGLPTGESLQRAANLLFGDADLVEMAVSAEGKPLVLAPAITVR